jgi:hypothetical protein
MILISLNPILTLLLDKPSKFFHFLWSTKFKPKPYSKTLHFFFYFTLSTVDLEVKYHLLEAVTFQISQTGTQLDREEEKTVLKYNTSLSKPYRVELTPLPICQMGTYISRYTLKLMKLALCYTHQWITICVTLCWAHWLDATGSNTTLLYIITYIFRS